MSEHEDFCVETESDISTWLNKMPELLIMGEFETVYLGGEKNHPHGPELWQKIASAIFKRLNHYDGFIVTSPLYDILYNSAAVSFALPGINKPVIFTGSQLPIVSKELVDLKKVSLTGLGVKSNLINAVQVAGMGFGGVGLMFGNRCLRAVKSMRIESYSLNVFNSLDGSFLAKIDFGASLLEEMPKSSGQPELKANFSDKVLAMKYYPGLDFNLFKKASEAAAGIFLEVLPLAPMAEDFATNLSQLKIPVVVYNRYYVPKLDGDNLVAVFNLSKETALIKFIWALGQTSDLAEIRNLMLNNLCQEFIST